MLINTNNTFLRINYEAFLYVDLATSRHISTLRVLIYLCSPYVSPIHTLLTQITFILQKASDHCFQWFIPGFQIHTLMRRKLLHSRSYIVPIKIVIADDHAIFRDGLVKILKGYPEYEMVGTCSNGEELILLSEETSPDLIITDIRMPKLSGTEAIKAIQIHQPHIRCLVLSNFDHEYMIATALDAGATGYVTKGVPVSELFNAINTVYKNMPFFCKHTSQKLARMIGNRVYNPYAKKQKTLFSETEKNIIRLICQDKNCKEISELMFLSRRTIEYYRSNILKKMNVTTSAGVAVFAIKNAIFHCDE